MGEFLINFKANGTEQFAAAAKATNDALNKQEASAQKMSKWRRELADLARAEREAAEKKLPVEQQLEKLLQRRALLEERIAKSQDNQHRLTALRVLQARNDAQIRQLGKGGAGEFGLRDVLAEIPGAERALGLFDKMKALLGTRFLWVAFGTAVAGALIKMTREAIESSKAMVELSERSSLTLASMKAFAAASKSTNISLTETTIPAYRQFAKIMGEIAAGIGRSTTHLRALSEFGISIDEVRQKQPQELFLRVLKQLHEVLPTSRQSAAGLSLMGEAFDDLAVAARKGFAEIAESAKSKMSETRLGITEALAQMGVAFEKFFAKAKGGWSSLKDYTAATVTTLATAGAGLISAFPVGVASLLGFKKPAEIRDKAFQKIFSMWTGGTGEDEVKQKQKVFDDKVNAKQTEAEIESYKARIRAASPDEADDILDNLRETGKLDDYKKAALSQERLAKRRDSAKGDSASPAHAPTADALTRIGLFVGDPTGVKREMQKQETQLKAIRQQLEELNRNVNRE